MKRTLFFLLSIIAVEAAGQSSITGKVIDAESNEPVSGAAVYLPDIRTGTVTKADGTFELENIPGSTQMMQVSFIGFASYVKKALVGSFHLIGLKPTVAELNEIVITGTSSSIGNALNPVPTTVARREFLNEKPSANIVDAIETLPGVSQVSTGPAISKPAIRGLSFNRVVTLRNGQRQEGQQWGDEHGIEIDEHEIDRVEVLKGPGSLMYGSDAMGGVVNFLTSKPAMEGEINGRFTSVYQSNNGMIGSSFANSGNLDGISWHAVISGKKAGNYQNSLDGKVFNTGFEELNGSASIRLNRKYGLSEFYAATYNQVLGLTEGERNGEGRFIKETPGPFDEIMETPLKENDLKGFHNSLEIPRQSIGHFRAGLSNVFYLKNSKLDLNLGYQQNRRREFEDILDKDAAGLYFILNTFNYDVKYFFPEKKGWESAIGVNSMGQESINRGEEFLIPSYSLFDAGIYAVTRKEFNGFFISGGLRVDGRFLNSRSLFTGEAPGNDGSPGEPAFAAFKNTYGSISGSMGAGYALTERLTAKVNLSRGFRAPNIAELGSFGMHEGTFRYEIGNPDLDPETSIQIDAGLTYASEHVTAEIAAFYNNINNYIYPEKLQTAAGVDSIMDADDPASVFRFVQGEAELYGGEAIIDIHPHPLDWLHFENSFSIVVGRQREKPDSARHLPYMPAPEYRSVVRIELGKPTSVLANAYLKAEVEHNFRQNRFYSAYGTETATAAYTLVHAGAGTDILNRRGRTAVSLYLAANNLFDATYQNHLSRLKYAGENPLKGYTGLYNMGKNFMVKMIVPLDFKRR